MNADPFIGHQLKHYAVRDKLGQGGMGVVYRAEDTSLGRDVAIKVLPELEASNQERLTRLEREARLLARLNHPNIVTLYAVERIEGGATFLVMELVEGRTLSELLPSAGLELNDFFELAVPIAEAIASAHEVGISHRDIKPSNIIVTRQGWPKVLDFGLGKELFATEEDGGADQSTQILADQLTTEGSVVGTVPYMAPEQLMGKPGGATSDVFSLGILYYQMLTGKHPFRSGKSTAEVVSAILRDQPKPLSAFDLDVPNHLGRILRRCLEKEPERRYQQAIELRNELADLRGEVSSGSWNSLRLPSLPDEASSSEAVSPSSSGSSMSRLSGGISRADAVAAGGDPQSNTTANPLRLVLLATPLAALLLVGWLVLGGDDAPVERAADDKLVASFERELPADAVTLAVLPLENLGGVDDGTFARALTSEISSALTKMKGMNVVAQSAVRNLVGESPAALSQALGVNHLLSGSVTWEDLAPQQVVAAAPVRQARFNLRLVHVGSELQVWSDSWTTEIESVLDAQAEIAQRVTAGLGEVLLGLDSDGRDSDTDPEPEPGLDVEQEPIPRQQRTIAGESTPARSVATAETSAASTAGTSETARESLGAESLGVVSARGGANSAETSEISTNAAVEPAADSAAGVRRLGLRVRSQVPLTMVTVFSGEEEVFRQRFRFRGRRARSFESSFSITDPSVPLRVYVVPRGEAARYGGFELSADSHRLILEVDENAQLRARLVDQ